MPGPPRRCVHGGAICAPPGVFGAALPCQSGRTRASSVSSSLMPFLGLPATSSLNSASFLSNSSSSFGSSGASWPGAALIFKPVHDCTCSCCFFEKNMPAASSASAKRSVSTCVASANAALNCFMLKTRKTLQASNVALLFIILGSLCRAEVTTGMLGVNSVSPAISFAAETAALLTRCPVSSSVSNSNTQGPSLTISTFMSAEMGAPTIISSWYSFLSASTNASKIALASSSTKLSSGMNFGKLARRDCWLIARISKPWSTTVDFQSLSTSYKSGQSNNFTTFAASFLAFSAESPGREASESTRPEPMRASTMPSTSRVARVTR
mmetsp:Transcript_65422/g.114024  ORF Transcript_65422/g.114024 Transcript_65422/m.114024 type:complete len:325 (+) Transcript_65422:429-1403(+)